MTDSSVPPSDPVNGAPQQPYSPPPAAPAAPLSAADDKLWASLAHFGGVIGPLPSLLIFLILKDRGALVREESKEALNFQISATIAYVALWILSAILGAIFWPLGILIGFLQFALWIVVVIFSILGGVRVQQGGSYRYPFAYRFIK
ncbi:DUF4870 domain-containing protein [Amnibacterium flavum]|uniref:DUF4870 domain-containing protein n=1 Tax=Amnibacterium flavum TaxID=2173173 RepID=A0A2V1HST5_9MICO|nr:DUF4870 domain-containing protein [Amnibacterium flavum]PVZ94109.1 DUF4870 domain-containing protein [Amnibacterium flavum]